MLSLSVFRAASSVRIKDFIPENGRWIVATTVIGDIALIIVVSSLLSVLARRCGQPAVIGQILAGVLLGPSLLGRLPGHLTAHLFPHAVLPSLTSLAQVAVVTFMFTVGYELDFGAMGKHGRAVPVAAPKRLVSVRPPS